MYFGFWSHLQLNSKVQRLFPAFDHLIGCGWLSPLLTDLKPAFSSTVYWRMPVLHFVWINTSRSVWRLYGRVQTFILPQMPCFITLVICQRLVKMLSELVPPEVDYCLYQGACVFAGICLLLSKIAQSYEKISAKFLWKCWWWDEEQMIQRSWSCRLP